MSFIITWFVVDFPDWHVDVFWYNKTIMDYVGKTLGERYVIENELGQGAMSIVYQAHDQSLDRKVAVKLLLPHLARLEEATSRFRREARTVARLDHKNIISIFDYSGEQTEPTYLVMELIEGLNLAEFLERHPISVPEMALLLAYPILEGLGHAHENNVIHRDLKPENIMIDGQGREHLMDFGIARIADAHTLTQTGAILGSPAYMAPEYLDGKSADNRSDIYSMGAILYRMITGVLPYEAPTPAALFKKIANGDLHDPRHYNSKVCQDLAAVVAKSMAINPDDRYQTVQEFQTAIQKLLDASQISLSESTYKSLVEHFDETQQELQQTIIASNRRNAQEAIGNRQWSKALEYLDRILAYYPEDQEAKQQLEKIHTFQTIQGYFRTVGKYILVASVIFIVGYFGFQRYQSYLLQTISKPLYDGVSLLVLDDHQADGHNLQQTITPKKKPAMKHVQHKMARAKVGPVASGEKMQQSDAVQETIVRLHAFPYASIWLDDTLVAENAMQPVDYKVKPGEHTIRFEHPAGQTISEKIIIPLQTDKPFVVRRTLKPKPARLLINANDGALLQIGKNSWVASSLSRTEGIIVELPSKQFSYDYLVRVVEKGKDVWNRKIRFKAGKTITINIEPEKQRF